MGELQVFESTLGQWNKVYI